MPKPLTIKPTQTFTPFVPVILITATESSHGSPAKNALVPIAGYDPNTLRQRSQWTANVAMEQLLTYTASRKVNKNKKP
jgi:hypothetical protein